jgi:hypothetical protein
VLAHPAHSGSAVIERIAEFVDYGLRGVEVYYPYHTPEDVEALLELCRRHGLLATGGSDFHSYPGSHLGGSSVVSSGVALGSVHVPLACAERLREAAAGQKKG